MESPQNAYSNSQIELFQLLSRNYPDEQLDEIRLLIANYLLEKAQEQISKTWDEKGYNEDTINKWLNKE